MSDEKEITANGNTAQVVYELTRGLITPHEIKLDHPTDGTKATVLVLPNSEGGLRIEAVNALFDPFRERPKFRKGTANLNDVPSFIGHVNRFKNDESVLFADNTPSQPGIACVFDYHQRVNVVTEHIVDGDDSLAKDVVSVFNPTANPDWMQHRSSYAFPLDKAWKAWKANNGKWMGQEEFALFIEERNEDILARLPDLKDPSGDADKNLAELVDDLNAVLANRRTMMGLSVGLSITATSRVVNVTGINNGTGSIVFAEENTTQDHEGRKIDVPTMFLLGISVFENGRPYRVVARLRYKRSGGAIGWKYDLYRDDKAFDHAFADVCEEIRNDTNLPLFVGSPERS